MCIKIAIANGSKMGKHCRKKHRGNLDDHAWCEQKRPLMRLLLLLIIQSIKI
jgi:hypothetical protein